MTPKTTRILLLVALIFDLAFIGLTIAGFAAWGRAFLLVLSLAWGAVALVGILLGLVAIRGHGSLGKVESGTASPTKRAPWSFRSARRAPALAADLPGDPFAFNGYTLYTRQVEFGGAQRPIYFFAKSTPKSGTAIPKPEGYHVGVNERTGLPFLKKGTGADGEDLTPETEKTYRPQCAALTEDDAQCQNSARTGSKYCASHKGYQPPTAKGFVLRSDTASKVAARDTKPAFAGDLVRMTEKGSQCQALTASGGQCRNTVVAGAPYCVKHKGYRQPAPAAVVAAKDTRPRVRKAADTPLSVRKASRSGR